MSRTPSVLPSAWPFGVERADHQRFETVRELRLELASTAVGFAFLLGALLLWSWLWSTLCVLAAVAVAVASLVYSYRTLEDPSPPISPEVSRALAQIVWIAGVLAWLAIFAAALTRS